MPNAIAFLVVFSWPAVVMVLFWKLPLPQALVASILGGYLFLPSGVSIDLPILPELDKTLIPSLSAAIMCMIVGRGKATMPALRRSGPARHAAGWTPHQTSMGDGPSDIVQQTSRGRLLFLVLFIALFATPILTVYENPDPIAIGSTFIPGLKIYDIGSLILQLCVTFLPFWLAQRFLARPAEQVMLLRALVLWALVYSVLCLYEIRMSPQLNRMIYGFFPHSFLQHIRAGGFRPIVFLQHGLWVGIYLAMAIVSAATLFLWSKRNGKQGLSVFGWAAAMIWLILVLYLSKTIGAFAMMLLFVPLLFLAGVQGQLIFAMIVAGVTLFYPLLRGAGWVPVDQIYEVAQSFSEERAQSLKFRLDNEDLLLARASEKPFAGWGSWGRNLIYEDYTGKLLSVTDGAWIIVIGIFGWVGYISHFGLLTAPLFLMGIARRKLGLTVESSGLAMVLAINLLDLLPNATLTPITYMIAGALCGRYALTVNSPQMAANLRKPVRPAHGAWPAMPLDGIRPQAGAQIGSQSEFLAGSSAVPPPSRTQRGVRGGVAVRSEGPGKTRQPRRRPE
jgi:hypothetical protein